MKTALLSRTLVAAVMTAAAAGWWGVRLPPVAMTGAAAQAAPVQEGAAATGAVRDRAAWQPSPVPAPGAAITPAATTAVVRDRAAWQPSPIAATGVAAAPAAPAATVSSVPAIVAAGAARAAWLAPLQSVLASMGSLLPFPDLPGLAAPPAPAGGDQDRAALPTMPASTAAGMYLPLDAQFTAEQLVESCWCPGGLPAERGEWRHVSFYSRALGREVTYLAWLPPDYATSAQTYPTLYLLHGVGGGAGYGPEEWLGYGLTEDLDRMLALDLIEPMIVILPHGEQGYWINHSPDTDGTRWADFVAVDLVRHVDATFRTDPRREKRAIDGLSMGAHGALQLSLNFADTFGVAGAHSPTLRPFETSPEFFGDPAWFARYDPLTLARTTDAAARVATWIDVGHEDPWLPAAEALRSAYDAKQAPLTFRVLEGEHEGWYWLYYLPEYLAFYSESLSATAQTPQGAPVVAGRPSEVPAAAATGAVAAAGAGDARA